MKIAFIGALVSVLVMLCGCGILSTPIITTIKETQTVIKSVPNVSPNWSGDTFWVGFDTHIPNLHAGAIVDTWTENKIFSNGYRIYSGQPFALYIYNNTYADMQYSIELDNGYFGQPEGYEEWITITNNNPIVLSKTVGVIPLSIKVPNNYRSVASKWMFYIDVVPQIEGNIQTAACVAISITMK